LFIDVSSFGAFAGDEPTGGSGGFPRGGPSNRGNRGGSRGVSDENSMASSIMNEMFLLAKWWPPRR
jgi:hypothetical protein